MTAFICGCQNEIKKINSFEDLKHGRIACWQYTAYDIVARENFPDAEYFYLYALSDMIQSLKQNKIDAFVISDVYLKTMQNEGIELDRLPDSLGKVPIILVFSKNDKGKKICSEFNKFLAEFESNGKLDALKEKWLTGNAANVNFTKSNLSGENGTLIIAGEAAAPAFSFFREGTVTGFEVELFDNFCAANGYDYEYKITEFSTMVTEVSIGKSDVGMNALEYSEKRENTITASDPIVIVDAVAVINPENASEGNFFNDVKKRIELTLITEDRWKMILSGIEITLIITVTAAILGTIFGLLIFMLYREKFPFISKFIDNFFYVLRGIPILVLLMIFYYIIFGNTDISSIIIASISFSIIFSLNVFTMIKSGVEGIPRGQMEAALALGFSERRAFLKFIFPQIAIVFSQTYQLALSNLLLETSIVGYISVMDLTKMADLIRARTFDAFVPLILTAVIYFLLSYLIIKVTGKFFQRINPKFKDREKILEGVKL